MNQKLALGKLPTELLAELINTLPEANNEIIIAPGIGRDAAGLQIGNQLIAVTTDPITFTEERIATYSISVNINDVACLGCRPRWYTGVLLLPYGTTENSVRQIWQELVSQFQQYGIQSLGGHVEVTESVKIPVLIGQMLGTAIGDSLLNPAAGKPGDKILLWQRIAIEGTALIARQHEDFLRQYFAAEELQQMQRLLDDPGICIWPFVNKLLPYKGVVALHDPTEGGLATAIHELADATNCGVIVAADKISILSETKRLAEIFNINPLGLIASGCLLIVCRPEAEAAILAKFADEPLVSIGELTENSERFLIQQQTKITLPRYNSDEIIKHMTKIEDCPVSFANAQDNVEILHRDHIHRHLQ